MPGYRYLKLSKKDLENIENYKSNIKNNMNTKPVKELWKSRTIRLAVLQSIAGILAVLFAEDPSLVNIGWLATAKSVIDFFLRIDTNKELI